MAYEQSARGSLHDPKTKNKQLQAQGLNWRHIAGNPWAGVMMVRTFAGCSASIPPPETRVGIHRRRP